VCTTPSGVTSHTIVYPDTDWCATSVVATRQNPTPSYLCCMARHHDWLEALPPCQPIHTHWLKLSDRPDPPQAYPGQVKRATHRHTGPHHSVAMSRRLGHSENQSSIQNSSQIEMKQSETICIPLASTKYTNKKVDSTRTSPVVTHPSTTRA